MPKPRRYVPRSSFGWGRTGAAYADPKRGLVIHYDGSNQGLAGKPHSACVAYWKRTRKFHMRSRGWADIGYSFGVCGHGYVFEGRGLRRQQAAQPGGNSTWYSCTLMTGPAETPTTEQINAVRELRQWLMEPTTSIAGAVKGHRDFIATSCPGDKAYRMVTDGTFKGKPGSTNPPEDDDMPTYVSVDKTDKSRKEALTAGEWTTVYFDKNNSKGASGHHGNGDYPSLLKGACDYAGTISLKVEGLPEGLEGQARVFEVEDTAGFPVRERSAPVEFVGTQGATFITLPCAGHVASGRRMRVELTFWGGNDQTRPTVTHGEVRLQVWER